MTISSEDRKAGPFPGDGVTKDFDFNFTVLSATDLLVIQTDTSSGAETPKTYLTDYTVTLNPDQDASPGGRASMIVAPPVGQKITLSTELMFLQPTKVTNLGGFFPEVITKALDRVTILLQQLKRDVDRSVKVNLSSSSTPDQLLSDINTSVNAASAAASVASAAAASAASILSVDGIVKGDGDGGVSAAVAGTDYLAPGAPTNFTAPQRAALTTDNDLAFDLSAKQNWKCTPTANGTLTFTNAPDGLAGSVVLTNTANYIISAAATTKISAEALARISETGKYRIDYLVDGTDVLCTASENLA